MIIRSNSPVHSGCKFRVSVPIDFATKTLEKDLKEKFPGVPVEFERSALSKGPELQGATVPFGHMLGGMVIPGNRSDLVSETQERFFLSGIEVMDEQKLKAFRMRNRRQD